MRFYTFCRVIKYLEFAKEPMKTLFLFLTILCLLMLQGHALGQETGPQLLPPSLTSNADDIYTDSSGFIIIQSKEISTPGYGYPLQTSSNITPIDKFGIRDEDRSMRVSVGEGTWDNSIESGSATLNLTDVTVGLNDDICVRKSEELEIYERNGSRSIDITSFTGRDVDGTDAYYSTLQGAAGSFTDIYRGLPVRNASGILSYVTLKETEGSYGNPYDGLTRYHNYYFIWFEGGGNRVVKETNSLPDNAAAGGSCLENVDAIIVGNSFSNEATWWHISDSEFTSGTLAGYPSAVENLSVTESSSSEIVVLNLNGGELDAWSSVDGNNGLGISGPSGRYASWFDDSGAYHAYTGELSCGTVCPIHVWRSSSGDWQATELCDYADGEELISASFDMTGMKDLKVGLHTRTATHDTIRLLRFSDGTWTSEVIDISPTGTTFDHLHIGGTADAGFTMLYSRETPSKIAEASTWYYYLEHGTLFSAAGAWDFYR